jgi:hypothetical protein
VPGASEQIRRVKVMNANWMAGGEGEDGRFELMIVTADDAVSRARRESNGDERTRGRGPARRGPLSDPANRTLTAANLRATMP